MGALVCSRRVDSASGRCTRTITLRCADRSARVQCASCILNLLLAESSLPIWHNSQGPIIGNEDVCDHGSIDDPRRKKERRYHLGGLLAKNATGVSQSCQVSPALSHLRGMRGRGIFSRACIDKQVAAPGTARD